LTADVAVACWRCGDPDQARGLLERIIHDVGRHLGQHHAVRLRSLAALRDLLIQQLDYEQAAAAQREILESKWAALGSDHVDTLAAKTELASILMSRVEREPGRNV
jgi:hypothetical protein